MFSAFRGPAQSRLKPEHWDLFRISSGRVATPEVIAQAAEKTGAQLATCALTEMFVEPEFDSDYLDEVPGADDIDAVLAYLNSGGMVAKVPDYPGCSCCRYYTILWAREWYEPGAHGDKSSEETAMVSDSAFLEKIYEFFPDLKGFDVETGERGLFKESFEALQRVLPEELKGESLVVGTFLLRIMCNPESAGNILVNAWQLRRRWSP